MTRFHAHGVLIVTTPAPCPARGAIFQIHTIMAPPIPRSTAYNSLRDASVAAALVGEQIDGQGVVAVEEDKLAEPEPGALHHERVV